MSDKVSEFLKKASVKEVEKLRLKLKGDKGARGKQGLQGEKGDKGDEGIKGDKGDTGSAGEAGAKGEAGEKGEQGEKGEDGTDGKNGIDGEDGLSAYQIWLSKGNKGSIEDFLKLLRGPRGHAGYGATWGAISGTLSDQTDLQAALDAISAGVYTYMFAGIVSDIATYYQAPALPSYTIAALATITTAGVSTTPTLLGAFSTNTGFPNTDTLLAGTMTVHVDTKKLAGANNYYIYAEVYTRTSGGTETLIATSDNSTQSAVNTVVNQTITALLLTNTTLLSTDRLVVKIYGVMLSSTATIDLRFDDATSARIELTQSGGSAETFSPYANYILAKTATLTRDANNRIILITRAGDGSTATITRDADGLITTIVDTATAQTLTLSRNASDLITGVTVT